VLEVKTLGLEPHPQLYQRLADLREIMGRYDEARAWHRLVLRDYPDNALSLAALGRASALGVLFRTSHSRSRISR